MLSKPAELHAAGPLKPAKEQTAMQWKEPKIPADKTPDGTGTGYYIRREN